MSAKNASNKVVFLSKKNIKALTYWCNRSRIALKRRGATNQEVVSLIEFEKVLDKIHGVKKLF